MRARGTQEAVFSSSTKEGTGGDRKKPSRNAKPPNQPSAFSEALQAQVFSIYVRLRRLASLPYDYKTRI